MSERGNKREGERVCVYLQSNITLCLPCPGENWLEELRRGEAGADPAAGEGQDEADHQDPGRDAEG